MGLRIHKQIGYGLNDVKTNRRGEIIDPRFNPKGFLGPDRCRRNEKWNVADYATWLDKRYESLEDKLRNHMAADYHFESAHFKMKPKSDNSDFRDFITHGGKEVGLSKVICIIPTMMYKEWHRWDDAIDYVEHRSIRSYTKFFDSNFFPWSPSYWDIRTGKTVEDAPYYLRLKANKVEKNHRLTMAKFVGFENCEEADLYLKPRVPSCVQLMCEYCELFSEPKIVRQLRPMMYVYWA